MIIKVSISQFRQNLADYMAKVVSGDTAILENEKKDQPLIQLASKRKFNPNTFSDTLKEASGIFTAENHPEWQTKEDVVKWIAKSRSDNFID